MLYTRWKESLSTDERNRLGESTKSSSPTLTEDTRTFIEKSVDSFIQTLTQNEDIEPVELEHIRARLDPIYIWRLLHLQAHLKHLPYPLSRKSIDFIQQRFRMAEGEQFPQFSFLLTATISLLARQWAICVIQAYLVVFNGSDPKINTKIIQSLRAPTDNQWWNLAKEIVQWMLKGSHKRTLMQHPIHHFILSIAEALSSPLNLSALEKSDTHSRYSKKSLSKINTVADGMKHLLDFRNALIHATKLQVEDITEASITLEAVLQSILPLNRFDIACKVQNVPYILQGLYPKPMQNTPWEENVQNGELVLLMNETTILCSISPLMSLASDIDKLDDEQDIFFINAGSLQQLKYVGFVNGEYKDGKTLGSYQQFKKYIASIPVPVGTTDRPRIDFRDFIEDKTKNFVGRGDVLNEAENCVATKGGYYCFLLSLAGMGKSAIMSKLAQLHPLETTQGKRTSGDIWIYHYCMHNDGRDQPVNALRSLITQLQFALKGQEGQRPSMKLDDLKEEFQRLLNTCQDSLERRNGSKVVVVIDALDESSFMEDDSIASCIPDYIADHVVFICSYRVNDECVNTRVQNHLEHLPTDKMYTLTTAQPLRGLSKENVHSFIRSLSDSLTNTECETALGKIWSAASEDLQDAADPFYLRFVADGVEKNQYFMKHPETIPTSLNDAFENMWLSLPSDRNFLAHRLLITLAIMRDMGDDELFAELFERQFPDEKFSVDDIAAIRRSIGKLLIYDGDRYGLFHDRFKYFLVGEQPDPIEEALAKSKQ